MARLNAPHLILVSLRTHLSDWRLLLALNALLGVAVWLDDWTDYQVSGSLSSMAFPIIAAVVALATRRGTCIRVLRLICVLPIVGGAGSLLFVAVLLVPP